MVMAKFVAFADEEDNRVMFSSDGINWTAGKATETSKYWYGATYGDGFLAVGGGGCNMWSANGTGLDCYRTNPRRLQYI